MQRKLTTNVKPCSRGQCWRGACRLGNAGTSTACTACVDLKLDDRRQYVHCAYLAPLTLAFANRIESDAAPGLTVGCKHGEDACAVLDEHWWGRGARDSNQRIACRRQRGGLRSSTVTGNTNPLKTPHYRTVLPLFKERMKKKGKKEEGKMEGKGKEVSVRVGIGRRLRRC